MKYLHKVMTIDKDTIYPFKMDITGNLTRSTQRFPYNLCIWLIHTPISTIGNCLTKHKYFSQLQTLRRKTDTHKNVHIHPILSLCRTNKSDTPQKEQPTIQRLIDERKKILGSRYGWLE